MTNLKIETLDTTSLIGKTISAQGWHYDNGGSVFGTITEITYKYSRYNVYVSPNNEFSMKSFAFTASQMQLLLLEGRLPEANRLLNTGTNAEIK